MPTVQIPALLEHQDPVALSPARWKLLGFGRRWGKDIHNVHVLVVGHGPEVCPHEPGECQRSLSRGRSCWVGIVDGFDMVWLAPDFPQGLTTLWEQEVKPRFDNREGIDLNQQEHSVKFQGLGTLWVRSAENIDSIRGLGKRLGGVLVNEAAHLHLEYAWRKVLRPALMDNAGWAVFSSTTNSGLDGNPDQRTPSFFNMLCEQVKAGLRDAKWAYFSGDARENPEIGPAEFKDLVREYAEGSIALDEEVYAKLLAPGAGLCFPQWDRTVHVLNTFQPLHHRIIAGMDWGIRNKSVIVLGAQDHDKNLTWFKEWTWTDKDAFDAGRDWGFSLLESGLPIPEYVLADAQMWAKTGIGGKTIGQEFIDGVTAAMGIHTPPIVPAPHGPGSRAVKLSIMQRMLKWGPRLKDGTLPPSLRPQMTFVGPECSYCCASIPTLPYDRKSKDQIDTDADDHGADAIGNVLVAEYGKADKPVVRIEVDRHPGLIPGTAIRRSRVRSPETEAEEELIQMEVAGVLMGGRYGPRGTG